MDNEPKSEVYHLLPPQKPEPREKGANEPLTEVFRRWMLYALMCYREKIGPKEFKRSNAGYLYYLLNPPTLPWENKYADKDSEKDPTQKGPSLNGKNEPKNFATLLKAIDTNETAFLRPNITFEPMNKNRVCLLPFFDERRIVYGQVPLKKMVAVAIIDPTGRSDNLPQASEDPDGRLQLSIRYEEPDQNTPIQFGDTSYTSAQIIGISLDQMEQVKNLSPHNQNSARVDSLKIAAQEAIKNLPPETELIIYFQTASFDGKQKVVRRYPLGFFRIIVGCNEQIAFQIAINTAQNDETPSSSSPYEEIITIPPEDHGVTYKELDGFLKGLYERLNSTQENNQKKLRHKRKK